MSTPSPSVDSTPLLPSTSIASPDDRLLYQAQLGSLMYLSVWTRPDLSERCSKLGKYAHNPNLEHASSIRRVFAYLKGSTHLALHFQAPNLNATMEIHSLGFAGFTDAAYADSFVDLKSTSGYVFKFASGPVSWRSRKQSITTTSSTEVEYIGYSLAAKEALWLRQLLQELDYISSNALLVTLYGDNQLAISLTKNAEHHARTKHIAIHWHFI